jgi:regulator of replication initiation timing
MSTDTHNADLNSMMKQIAALEAEKKKLMDEKEQLGSQLQSNQDKVKKLTEKTKSEMQGKFDTVVSTWIDGLSGTDEAKKEEFKNGLRRLVTDTRDDSGIWQVVCCASEQNAQSLAEMERIRVENEELKQKVNGGRFAKEEDRVDSKKRKSDEVSNSSSATVWDDFELMMKTENGISA